MATPLIPALDTSLTRQAMAFQADLFQNLGNQIRKDITTVVTNRQMQGLAEGLQSVDTTSPQFGRQVAGLFAQYPLAAQSPLGQAAISQLGAEFKLNQQIAAEDRRFRNQLGGYAAKDYIENRPYGTPVTAEGLYSVATGSSAPASTGGVSTPSGTPFAEPPLPVADPLFDATGEAEFIGPRQPNIPAAQPQTAAPVAPINNVGAQIQAYDQQLRQQRVPQHLAEGMLRSYAQSLTTANRPASQRIESTNQGLMRIGPDGVATPVTTADGKPLARMSGNPENMTADNTRSDASMRLREVGQAQDRMNSALKRLNGLEIGGQGPWQEDGKWFKLAPPPKGREEIPAEIAKKWLDINHEYAEAQSQYQTASQEYQALVGRTGATASPASPAAAPVRTFNYIPGQGLTPAQ
jgi:hypothetical protein